MMPSDHLQREATADPAGGASLLQLVAGRWVMNVAFASDALAMIPAIPGYLIGQRWIIGGIMRGAIKSVSAADEALTRSPSMRRTSLVGGPRRYPAATTGVGHWYYG